ncbi:hypothetical protein MSG37_17265 [Shewanella sp. 1CM18E]|uniref:hypothetical protein n=1 Tax=Shewanella sp. 1CM18E TaxID=2929169 RepID=UPI0020BDEE83|nr:hypothetical protein [Shewanella sp. 1CM18E]MCK8046640.1 hypothetical protein [Shewanella sp. 1CM18E]
MVNTFSKLALLLFTVVIPLQSSAVEVPIIFDYLPNCVADDLGVIKVISQEPESNIQQNKNLQNNEKLNSLRLALLALTKEAKRKGADAVIITNVNHHITKHENDKKSQYTKIEANGFIMCANDKSLSNTPAPYNAKGYQVTNYTYELTFIPNSLEKKSAYDIAKTIKLPEENVSISTGAFGVKIGSNFAETIAKLGPPSIEIILDNNQILYGYGRRLWFTFREGSLINITSKQTILSGAGLNSLGFRPKFDESLWKIEGVAVKKSDITKVKDVLTSTDFQLASDQILLKKKDQELVLDFNSFSSTATYESQLKLANFTLRTSDKESSGKPKQLPQQHKQWLLNKFLSPTTAGQFTLNELKQRIPFTHKINIASDYNTWLLIGNHILIKFDEQVPKQVKISESLFSDTNEHSFLSSISLLEIPLSKAEMIDQYNEAVDNYDIVDIETTTYSLQARYDSYEDDALLYELEISYF